MTAEWPFEEPPNVATMTVRDIIDGRSPIRLVTRDEEDGTWQFLTGGPFEMADGRLVTLRSMLLRDPSIGELADLPIGWQAWRDDVSLPWHREPADDGEPA